MLPPLQWSKETDMSTLDLSLLLNGVDRGAARGALRSAQPPLRMVLVEGEALRLPLSLTHVSVLSGTAWITQAGSDTLLQAGDGFALSAAADRAVISAVRKGPLFFEML
jgi:hypothetical protein